MKIGRQIIVSTIIYVAIFLLGLVCTKVLTNGLSVADFGTYSLILSTIGIAALFLGFGFDKYIFIKVAGQDKAKGFSAFTSTYIFESLAAAVLITVGVGAGLLFIGYLHINISYQTVITAAFILLMTVMINDSLRFHGLRKRLEFKAVMGLLQERLWVLPLFLLWRFAGSINLDEALMMKLVPSVLVVAISLWVIMRSGETTGGNKIFDSKIITEGLAFGVPLIILDAGDTLLSVADRYIIAIFASSSSVGYYSLAYSLANIAYGLTSSVIWIFFPYFAEAYNLGKKDASQVAIARNIFNCSLKLCLIIGLFVSAALVSFRVPIIKIFSSPEYLAAAPAMAILAAFPVFLILTYLFHQILLLERQKKTLIKGYVFAPLLNIALNFVLIPVFGIAGAAIATVVSYLAIFLFFLSKIKKYGILNLSRRFVFKLGACLVLAAAPLYFFHPGSIMELLFLAAASGIVYLLSLIFLSVVGKEEFDILFPGLFKKNNRDGAVKP